VNTEWLLQNERPTNTRLTCSLSDAYTRLDLRGATSNLFVTLEITGRRGLANTDRKRVSTRVERSRKYQRGSRNLVLSDPFAFWRRYSA
jgi:hypothetical protein